jgi:hypothetical protein
MDARQACVPILGRGMKWNMEFNNIMLDHAYYYNLSLYK